MRGDGLGWRAVVLAECEMLRTSICQDYVIPFTRYRFLSAPAGVHPDGRTSASDADKALELCLVQHIGLDEHVRCLDLEGPLKSVPRLRFAPVGCRAVGRDALLEIRTCCP